MSAPDTRQPSNLHSPLPSLPLICTFMTDDPAAVAKPANVISVRPVPNRAVLTPPPLLLNVELAGGVDVGLRSLSGDAKPSTRFGSLPNSVMLNFELTAEPSNLTH